VIRCNEDVCALHIVDDNAEDVGKLLHGIFTSLKHFLLSRGFISNGINGVVVDVNHFFATYKLTAICAFHVQYIRVLNGNAVGITGTKDFLSFRSRTAMLPIH